MAITLMSLPYEKDGLEPHGLRIRFFASKMA